MLEFTDGTQKLSALFKRDRTPLCEPVSVAKLHQHVCRQCGLSPIEHDLNDLAECFQEQAEGEQEE